MRHATWVAIAGGIALAAMAGPGLAENDICHTYVLAEASGDKPVSLTLGEPDVVFIVRNKNPVKSNLPRINVKVTLHPPKDAEQSVELLPGDQTVLPAGSFKPDIRWSGGQNRGDVTVEVCALR